jgi:NADPH:quinone reductase-like Zn-dependent oxidoreductase
LTGEPVGVQTDWGTGMRVFEIRDSFGIDSLVVAERPMPKPEPGRVIVRITAAT